MNPLYWFRSAFRWFRGQPRPLGTLVVEELPDSLDEKVVYLLGVNQAAWAVAFLCPCGCKSLIELNLLPEARPCWRVRRHRDMTNSLWPSVDRLVGCRSHFWLRRGLVEWACDSRR